jgi:CheY-like chemotaxis protein
LDGGERFIEVDAAQLEQILMNLVLNARDSLSDCSSSDKRIVVETGVMAADELGSRGGAEALMGGRYGWLSVSDNGGGMDECVKERIFEPFFTTKAQGKGTGLGLATVYGAVSQCGGIISVDSVPGKGAVFKVCFPEAVGSEDEPRVPSAVDATGCGERIFVVEDEADVLDFTVRSLSNLGYSVFSATNGREALERLECDSFECELILTDVVMPEMNGVELVERVHSHFPGIKVVFTSGYSNNLLFDGGKVSGKVNFLRKPYSINALAMAVRNALDIPAPFSSDGGAGS